MVTKPKPKYGWHPSTTTATGFVDEYGVTIGSRVHHQMIPDHFGEVVDGPMPGRSAHFAYKVWMVNWEPHPRSGPVHGNPHRHTVGTLRLAST